jgi:hypothetical protein
VLKHISSGKALETDNIAPEILKVDVKTSARLLQPILERIWTEEKL